MNKVRIYLTETDLFGKLSVGYVSKTLVAHLQNLYIHIYKKEKIQKTFIEEIRDRKKIFEIVYDILISN